MSKLLLAAKLIELRQHFNYSQQDVANYLIVSRVAYSHYERGVREPNLEILMKLCKLYHINISELINEKTIFTSTSNVNTKSIEEADAVDILSSPATSFITNNIYHFFRLFTGKYSNTDFTDISKRDLELLIEYKKLDAQSQKEVKQFIKFKYKVKK